VSGAPHEHQDPDAAAGITFAALREIIVDRMGQLEDLVHSVGEESRQHLEGVQTEIRALRDLWHGFEVNCVTRHAQEGRDTTERINAVERCVKKRINTVDRDSRDRDSTILIKVAGLAGAVSVVVSVVIALWPGA